jgi:hypothetical protein
MRAMGLLLLATSAGAVGVDVPGGATIALDVSNRVRGEFVDWFDAPGLNARHAFVHNRFRLGVRLVIDPIEVGLEYQNTVIGAVPEDAPGPGGAYRANTNRDTQVGNWIREGWLGVRHRLDDYELRLRVGRQTYYDGAELESADPTLSWLRGVRVSERLIGPFDFTAVGRSFDGVLATVDHRTFVLTGFAFHPTSGGFEIDAGRDVSGIDLAGASYALKDRPGFERTNARLFWIYYADDRPGDGDVVALDNRPEAVRAADRDEIVFSTVGADLLHVWPVGPGAVDLLAWTAGQFGDWQRLDHRAWAFALEAGYRLPDWPAEPWLRGGLFRSSGDDDPADGRHETFHQLLPTARKYAQVPFYNLMNDQDVFMQVLLHPTPALQMRIDGHWLQVAESADLAYFGGGATKDDFFGFGGVPARGERDLAHVVDLEATYRFSKYLSASAYYAHAFGQGVVRAAFDDAQLDYGYVELTVSF